MCMKMLCCVGLGVERWGVDGYDEVIVLCLGLKCV